MDLTEENKIRVVEVVGGTLLRPKLIPLTKKSKSQLICDYVVELEQKYNAKLSDKSRKKNVINLRRWMCYILSENFKMGPTDIGKLIGITHSDVIYHRDNMKEWMNLYATFREEYNEIMNIIEYEEYKN